MRSRSFVTWLGDVVHVRFDDDGNEHVTLESAPHVQQQLELVPEPGGMDALAKYRSIPRHRSK